MEARSLAVAFSTGLVLAGLIAVVHRLHGARVGRRRPAGVEDLLRSAFDDALVGMSLIGMDGRYLRVNAAYATMLGLTPADLAGRQFQELTHPEDAAEDVAAVQRTMTGAEPGLKRTKRYRHPDGSVVHVELSTVLVRGADGQPLHYATHYVDVTEHRRAQRERDTHDLMLRGVIANSQSLIYVKDVDGRYLLANEPFQRAFGVSESELLGHDDTYLDPELAPVWRVNDLRAQKEEYHVAEWSDGPDGRHHYDSVKFPLRDPDGEVYATCGISLDVTQSRCAAEEMAHARDAALEATRAKSSFLATMSHEIRTPMNAVIGMTGLLLDTRLDAEQREFLETVRTSGDTLLTIINDILDFSKIEAGELTLDHHPFALRECLESALALVSLAAENKALELVADIDGDCPELLVGDVTRFRQVIVNLLSNAVKFTAAGEVVVSVSATPVDPGPSLLVQVAVRDTGIGIPANRADRLFQSFSQVDASTTREYGGTGLGLVISRRLAQAMGGDLDVVSEVGVGSTFTMSAVLTVAEDRRDDRDGTPVTLHGRTALIVDDNATNRRVLSLQLQRWGVTCTDVAEPAAALALLTGGQVFDVAVLDMHMPVMDGQQLALELRKHPAGRDLPLVLLSSLQTRLDQEAVTAFAAVLSKPARSALLHDALAAVLNPVPATLKRLETAGGRRGQEQGPAEQGASLRVLLAEDNLVNQKVAQLMLGRAGHRVDTVSNGREALDAVHRARYDVVLMDVQMPVLDGLAATGRIRAEIPTDRQPYIIALTASALAEDRTACTAAGVDAFLSKPVRQSELDRALAAVRPTVAVQRAATRPPPKPTGPVGEDDQRRTQGILARLNQLRGSDPDRDRELFSQLLLAFLDLVPGGLSRLEAAAVGSAAADVPALAHLLKGSAGNLGATRLEQLCNRLEVTGGGPVLLEQVRTELLDVSKVMRAIVTALRQPAHR